jgi:hypothetical protein
MTTADSEGKRKGNHWGSVQKIQPGSIPVRTTCAGKSRKLYSAVSFGSIRKNYPFNKPEKSGSKKNTFFLIIAGTSIPPQTGKKEKLREIALKYEHLSHCAGILSGYAAGSIMAAIERFLCSGRV